MNTAIKSFFYKGILGLITIWLCTNCADRNINNQLKGSQSDVNSSNLEITKNPFYHKHSYKGPIRSVKIINLPEAYTRTNFFGRIKRENTYMSETNTPLEYESNSSNYHLAFDSLGNKTMELIFSDYGIGAKKDSIFNWDKNRIQQMIHTKKIKQTKLISKLYNYNYNQLNVFRKNYGEGQEYYPPYWNLFSFGAPTYKSISYIKSSPPVFNKEDTVLTFQYTHPITGKKKTGNYYGAGDIFKFETLPQKTSNIEKVVKTWGDNKVLGANDSLFNTSLITLESYNNGKDKYDSEYSSTTYYSLNKFIEVKIQSQAEYHYNSLGLITHKKYTGNVYSYDNYVKAWIDNRCSHDYALLNTDYIIPKNRGVDTVVEYFEYDDQYRLTDQYLVTKHNFKDYKKFYYSGNKSMPDSIYANFIRLSNSDTPGEFTGLPFMAHLDDDGNVTELDYMFGYIITDSLGHKSFQRAGIESKRILKYSGYDKYGNWTKVDKYVWHNPDPKKFRYHKNEERQKFWSKTRFVGSQERIFEYYED